MTDQPPGATVLPDFPAGVPIARPLSFSIPPVPPPRGIEFLLLDQTRRSAWADIGRLVLLLILMELVIETTVGVILRPLIGFPAEAAESESLELPKAMLMPSLALRAVGVFFLITVLVRGRRQRAPSVGFRGDGRFADVGLGLAILVLTYGLIVAAMLSLCLIWPELGEQMNENAFRIMDLVPNVGPLGFAAIATIIGLYEELLFRGFLMPRLRRATGSWTAAVVLSTVVFTALHAFEQTVAALIVVSILSLIFSLVTIWRRSILPAIVAHLLFNLSQFLGLYYQAGDTWK